MKQQETPPPGLDPGVAGGAGRERGCLKEIAQADQIRSDQIRRLDRLVTPSTKWPQSRAWCRACEVYAVLRTEAHTVGLFRDCRGSSPGLFPAQAQAQRNGPNLIEKCLHEVWLDKKPVSDCYMLVSNNCKDGIVKAGVNYGISIVYVCAKQETEAWFEVWMSQLLVSQWSEDGRAKVLARFADVSFAQPGDA